MSKKNRTNNSNNALNNTGVDYFAFLILVLASAIVPLVVLMQPIKLEGILYQTWTGVQIVSDFFSYNKSMVLVFCFFVLIIYWAYKVFSKQVYTLPKLFIPLGVYTVFIIISTIFAQYKDVAIEGFVDRFEGFYVLVAYVLLTITAAWVIKTEKLTEISLIAIFTTCTLIAILGLTQFYDVDFLQTTAGKKLMLPRAYEHIIDTLRFTFAGQKIMYTTVYNPNYLGSYAAMLLPIAIGLYYSWAQKGGWRIILGLLFTAASFVLLLGGMSRAGLLGIVVAGILLFIILRKRVVKSAVYTILLLGLLTSIYITMDLTSDGAVTKEVMNTLPSSIIKKDTSRSEQAGNIRSTKVKEMKLNNEELLFQTESEGLIIKYDSEDLSLDVKDLEGKTLTIVNSANLFRFEEEKYKDYQVTVYINGFDLKWIDTNISIRLKDGRFMIQNEDGSLSDSYTITNNTIQQVSLEGMKLTFKTDKETFVVMYGDTGFTYSKGDGTYLKPLPIETQYTFEDNRYLLYTIIPGNKSFYLKWNNIYLPFVINENGNLTYMQKNNTSLDQIQNPPVFGPLVGYESFANNRGYIWSRSIPLLRNTLIKGYGPDSYAIYYPQGDVVGKINFMKNPSIVVDKPHNWYLQLGINTGVISLISMLIFLGWFWLKGIKTFIADKGGSEYAIGGAILCGVSGYLVAALFNDSTVSVAPVFWVVLGLGIALLNKLNLKRVVD